MDSAHQGIWAPILGACLTALQKDKKLAFVSRPCRGLTENQTWNWNIHAAPEHTEEARHVQPSCTRSLKTTLLHRAPKASSESWTTSAMEKDSRGPRVSYALRKAG